MPDRARLGRRLAVAVLSLIPWLALACRPGVVRATSSGAAGLADGPTRWLMLPEEIRQAERLRTTREAVEFVEELLAPPRSRSGRAGQSVLQDLLRAGGGGGPALRGRRPAREPHRPRARPDPPGAAAGPALQPEARPRLGARQAGQPAGDPLPQPRPRDLGLPGHRPLPRPGSSGSPRRSPRRPRSPSRSRSSRGAPIWWKGTGIWSTR